MWRLIKILLIGDRWGEKCCGEIEWVFLFMGCWVWLSLMLLFVWVVYFFVFFLVVNGSCFYIVWGFWFFFLFYLLLIVRWVFKWKINENICFLEVCYEEVCLVFFWVCVVCWKCVVGCGFIEMNGVYRVRDFFGLLVLIVVFLVVEICYEGNCCNCFFFVIFLFWYF